MRDAPLRESSTAETLPVMVVVSMSGAATAPRPKASSLIEGTAMSGTSVYAVTAKVHPSVADALGDAEATRARLVVAADSQAEALSAFQIAGNNVFTSTFRRYGGPTGDEREIATAAAEPGAVFAFSVERPDATPVRLVRV